MKYLKYQFIEDVKKEIISLRKHATPEETHRLSLEEINPTTRYKCIYGLMTGSCQSPRAIKLISKCCKRYVDTSSPMDIPEKGFKCIAANINGTKPKVQRTAVWLSYLSSLEAYSCLRSAKIKNVVKYLKGETNNLSL